MLRIGMFLATNLAVLIVISTMFRLLGFEGLLQENGVDLNLQALLIYSALIGFAGSFISLLLSKRMAKTSMRVQVIEQPRNETERWLMSTVKQQAEHAGIKTPEFGIFDHTSPNAFATGWNKNDALVAVSTGLLQHMQRDEVEAVVGHEISHVANGDMVTLALIQGVMNTFVVFLSRVIGFLVDRLVFRVERGHGPGFWIASIVAEILLGILATMVVMWFSRWREYRADEGGASLTSRQSMIGALRRLQSAQQGQPLPDEMRALAINAGKVQAMFSSHPPLEQRIAALQNA